MSHVYSDEFYDYIERGSRASARAVIKVLEQGIKIDSVLDVGCGRGAWLSEWIKAGFDNVTGLDGDYVDRERLHIPPDRFAAADLTQGFDLDRHYDIVQCLEVAEHLPAACANILVDSLCRHGDILVFSAATPGQGGEHHINEKPLSFWRQLFADRGYEAFDLVRPNILADKSVMPWYKFNTLVYANAEGRLRLSAEMLKTKIESSDPIPSFGSFGWRLRKAVVRLLPQSVANWIAELNAKRMVALARRHSLSS